MVSDKAGTYWTHAIPMVKGDVTVQHFIDLIQQNRRHHYSYDKNKSGCLFWSKTVMRDFATNSWVKHEDVDAIDGVVDEARKTEGYWVPKDEGRFL
jgi:hypothetical protein